MKAILSIIGILVLVCVLALVLGTCRHLVSNPLHQAGRIVDKTVDADNVIYNYEYFKTQYREILAMDAKIDGAWSSMQDFLANSGPRDAWDFRDKEEASRLRTVHSGMQNVRNEMVAQYNARANMANRKIFMESDVPASIE